MKTKRRIRVSGGLALGLLLLLLLPSMLLMSCGQDARTLQEPEATAFEKGGPTTEYLAIAAKQADIEPFLEDTKSSLLRRSGLIIAFSSTEKLRDLEQDPRLVVVQPNFETTLSWPINVLMGFFEGGFDEDDYPAQDFLQCLQLDQVHAVATGQGIRVAVLDTGVDSDHPHLQGRLEIHDKTALGNPEELHSVGDVAFGHGTHVAGIIATMAPSATILPFRVLPNMGTGTAFDVAVGLQQAMVFSADVVNMSLSMDGDSPVIQRLLLDLEEADIVVVAASGNDTQQSLPTFPSTGPTVFGVAATDTLCSTLADFSARGDVAFAAPGSRIISSYPLKPLLTGELATATGTSTASAVVSGAFCLLLEGTTDIKPAVFALQQNTMPLSPPGQVQYGIISPYHALGLAGN